METNASQTAVQDSEASPLPGHFPGRGVKILALCDSPVLIKEATATGFGRVARNLFTEWTALGAQIDVWAINFAGHNYATCPAWQLFPAGGGDWFRKERLQGFLERIATGDYTHAWILMDLDPFAQTDFCQQFKLLCKKMKVRTMLYFPVDAAVDPEWCGIVNTVDVAVSYTNYGREQVRLAMGKKSFPIQVLPHGVEGHFRMLPEEVRNKFRYGIEIDMPGVNGKKVTRNFIHPGDFVMMTVNKNEWRKDPFRSLEILAGLRAGGVPAKLILRMGADSKMGGTNIERAARQLGLTHGVQYFIMPPQPEEIMVGLYNAVDLYLTTTRGEGWGLGITEALACGCPVAMPMHTACGEIAEVINGLARSYFMEAIIPLAAGDNVCGMDSRIRPSVELARAVSRIGEYYVAGTIEPKKRREMPGNVREWLSWKRVAAEMFKLLTK